MEGKTRQRAKKTEGGLKIMAFEGPILRGCRQRGFGDYPGSWPLRVPKLSIIQTFASEFVPRIAR
jgi:hypothetical protein